MCACKQQKKVVKLVAKLQKLLDADPQSLEVLLYTGEELSVIKVSLGSNGQIVIRAGDYV